MSTAPPPAEADAVVPGEPAAPPAGAVAESGRSGFWLIIGFTAAVQLMLLATGVITARLLGVEGRGQVALVAAAAAMLTKLTLGAGTPVAVAQLLASRGTVARDALGGLWLGWAWRALLVGVVAGGYVAWAVGEVTPRLRWGLAGATCALVLLGIGAVLVAAALQGDRASSRRIAVGGVLLQAPFFLLVVVVFALGLQVDALDVALLQVLGGVVALLGCWRLLRRPTGAGERVRARELRAVARANYVAGVGSLNGIGLDRNLVGALLGTAALGLYAAAFALANLCTVVGTGVSTILLPRLSALAEDPEAARALRRQWLPAAAGLMVLAVLGLQVVVDPVITLAFGEEFSPAVEVARWLILADGFLGFRRVQTTVLQAQGRGGDASRIELVLTVVLVGAILGAAAASSLVLVGVAMAAVGFLSVVGLQLTIRRADRQSAPPRARHRA